MSTSEKLFYSMKECTRALGVSTPTLARWVRFGQIQTVKIGGRRLVAVATIEKLVADATAKAVS